MTEEDAALLADPTARAVWKFLRQRYPAGAIGLDVDLALDLNLDPLVIAAALPLLRMRGLYWAGMVRLFDNAASRLFRRTVHLFPVDERHPDAAVPTAARVLDAGKSEVWFPEGWRSPDGRLRRFLPGIGQLLLHTRVPAVSDWIGGAFEALPRGRLIPRVRQPTLDFGPAGRVVSGKRAVSREMLMQRVARAAISLRAPLRGPAPR